MSRFIFLQVDAQLFQCIFWKKLPLLHWLVFVPLSKISCIYLGLFLVSLFFSTDLFFTHSPVLHCLHYCSFLVSLEVRYVSHATLFFNILLTILWVFCLFVIVVVFLSIRSLVPVFCYPQNNFLEFLMRLHWIFRSNWEELTFW